MANDGHIGQCNKTASLGIDSHKHSHIFDTGAKTIQWRKRVFSTNDSGTTGLAYAGK